MKVLEHFTECFSRYIMCILGVSYVNTNPNYVTVDIFLKMFETKCWKEIEDTAVSFCSPGERQTWKSVIFVMNPSN